jgi:DNA polymerase (family 10)
LRQRAIKKGMKVNEYGLFDAKERCCAARTEKEVYQKLDLEYIEPELREDAGEIEAAATGALPRLIRLGDLRGDLHVHTDYSDGRSTLVEMVQGARKLGYEYVCLTDHSESLKVAEGLDKKKLKKKKAEIDQLNKKLKGFRILFGSEVEIDADGEIDYDKETLAQFDVVIGAIHTGFKQSKEQLTRRVIKACQHPHVHVIAHPTGRLWPTRPSYELDMEEVFKVCRETNTALELSAHPYRLDLRDVLARAARDKGVRLAINTDSHEVSNLGYMRFGIGTARRAWLEPKDVLNHLSWPELLKAIKK